MGRHRHQRKARDRKLSADVRQRRGGKTTANLAAVSTKPDTLSALGKARATDLNFRSAPSFTQDTAEPPAKSRSFADVDREFRLDQILLALWHGRLTADAAAERIVAEIGLGRQAARDEVDGFLRD
jgi:hypothetical protein